MRGVAVGLGLWLAGCRAEAPPAPALRALLTVDTWRLDHFSPTHTPALWAFAAGGQRFTNAWTPIGLTTPAHATMLTGRPPWETGVEGNNHHGYSLPEGIPTLPERYPGAPSAAFVSAFPAGPEGGLGRGWQRFDGPAEGERPGEEAVRMALDWLPAEGPGTLWVHLYEPHGPYVGAAATDPERYAEEVARADAALAPLLAALAARGALVVLAADHGEVLLEERCGRQHERSTHPAVLRVPLVRVGPGVPAEERPERVGLDLVPALLDGGAWGRGPLVGRAVTLAESGLCEAGCAPGCTPPGLLGRDRVAIDDGGRWVDRPGRGRFAEGAPGPDAAAAIGGFPPRRAPENAAVEAGMEALGYREPAGR